MKTLVVVSALLIGLGAVSTRASVNDPNPVNVVVEQARDSARIIVAWGASMAGTYPISHYWVRLVNPGGEDTDTLALSQALETVDSLYYAWPTDTTRLFRVGVQAEDSQGNFSNYIWSDTFQLIQPFYAPGDPGTPTVVVDTSLVVVLDMFRIVPDTLKLVEGFGSAVLQGRFYSKGNVVACGLALLNENPLTIVGVGDCGIPLMPADSIYDPWGFDFTTPAELQAGLRWIVN